jgi:prepilin-type N-terminal cleavage/methylation domain-containing protein
MIYRGFTLIETLVAIFILTVAITGPLTIASRGLNAALIAKDQTTAFFLAQDAVEYVRSVRDSNRLKGADWLTGAGGTTSGSSLVPCESNGGCTVDSINNTISSSGIGAPLRYIAATYQYTQASGGGVVTPFIRTVNITSKPTQGALNDEAEIVVTVSWSDVGQQPHSVVVREDLFNWE